MNRIDDLGDYELFYMELPRTETDPLNDISTEIQDVHESLDYDAVQGLSDEQVSEIARDSLEEIDERQVGEPLSDQQSFLLADDMGDE